MPRNAAPCTAPSKLTPRKASECTTPGPPLPRNAGLRTSCHAHAPRKSGKCTGHACASRPPLVQRPAFLGVSCRKLVHRAAFLGMRAGRHHRRGTARSFSRHGAVGHLGGNARRAAILGMGPAGARATVQQTVFLGAMPWSFAGASTVCPPPTPPTHSSTAN